MKSYKRSEAVIAELTPEQYLVTLQNCTGKPGTGEYLNNKQPGIYVDMSANQKRASKAYQQEKR